MQILTPNPSFLDWVPCFKGVTITVIIIPLSTPTNHPQWGSKMNLFWQKWLQHFELQDLCPVPERTAQQWCLNLFVSELTHSALYILTHMKDIFFYVYTRVFMCVYIFIQWLTWKNECWDVWAELFFCVWIFVYSRTN